MILDDLVGHVVTAIRVITGEDVPPPTCPWRALSDPLLDAVYAVRRRDGAHVPLGTMSLRLREAVAYFERCHAAAVADREKTIREQNAPKG